MLINLARGTGIHGLSGIKSKNGMVIRPLLFASRSEIEEYVKTRGIDFREDSSNTADKYARNYIRHHVIPGLEQFFPGVRQSIEHSMEHFRAVEMFYNDAIKRYKDEIVTVEDDLMYIDLHGLAQSPSSPALLYEILKPFGFSKSIASEILEEQIQPSGRQFFSETHRIVHDRQKLILQEIGKAPNLKHDNRTSKIEYLIDENTLYICSPVRLRIEQFDKYPDFKPSAAPDIACLDGDKLQYPLLLRKWEHGDRFRPLGMKNMKKLSDFFIDAKLSLIEKEQLWVLVSGGQIAWITGKRIDDRFKITGETKRIVQVSSSMSKV
jgi:tRNA(Ile)-lysidine synthase